MQDDGPPLIRWRAVEHYRTETGTVYAEHHLEELEELHDYIDLGPHWDTIEKIEVFRINHVSDEKLTVERALKLRFGEKKSRSIAAVRRSYLR